VGIDRTTSYTEIPVRSNIELARSLGLTWVGDWHVHDEGSGTPSSGDERAWTGLRGRDPGVWLGVIVTPGPGERRKMCDPVLHAWTVGDQGLRAASLQRSDY
jgi:hypothetical protein